MLGSEIPECLALYQAKHIEVVKNLQIRQEIILRKLN